MALTQVKTLGIADDAVTEAKVANDAISPTEMKAGTDGHIITYDASGNPTTVGPGTDGQVLTSTGAGSPPAFEDASAGATLSGSTDNTVVTVTGANAMQGESNVRIDSSGRLLVGATAKRNVLNQTNDSAGDSPTPLFYAEGTGDSKSLTIVSNNTNAHRGSVLGLARTRGTSVGDSTIVADNDNIGQIVFAAGDGTNIEHNCASIRADIDGTPGENDVPGRLVFSTTADGAALTTERMRIDESGRVQINATSAQNADSMLTIAETSGHCEVNILAKNDSGAVLNFGDPEDYNIGRMKYDHSANEFIWDVNNTHRLSLESGGDLNIEDGNLKLASGHGIDFSATSEGSGTSSQSELLADYEHGSWTPYLSAGTTGDISGGGYYNNQDARYTRIGRLVVANFYIACGSADFNNMTGDLMIKGLPFAPQSGHPNCYVDIAIYYNVSQNDFYNYWATAGYHTDRFYIYGKTASSQQQAMGTEMDSDTNLAGVITYMMSN